MSATRRGYRIGLLAAPWVVVACVCGLCGSVIWIDARDSVLFRRVQVGMSVAEVEAILGPGTPVEAKNVPGYLVSDPRDVAAAERAARAGATPPTARAYPAKSRGRVEDEVILEWVNPKTGERILVAFTAGRVCEKDYYDPNYL